MTPIISIIAGWTADRLLGDPERLPHPVVWFGKAIAAGERRLNKGSHRKAKGAAMSVSLTIITFAVTAAIIMLAEMQSHTVAIIIQALLIFYCLAGQTLIKEVKGVFEALDRSLDCGRKQVSRIVGRDTSQLTDNEVRKAALETLAENLSDGIIAPVFWLIVLGVPGMMAYKMINTLDSMIGYRTERYKDFGMVAARTDDAANFLPARLTALLMVLMSGRLTLLKFVATNGRKHASPNSGYPEAALAGILNCRFGGGHTYFNEYFYKPYIGDNERQLTTEDMRKAVKISRRTELAMLLITLAAETALVAII